MSGQYIETPEGELREVDDILEWGRWFEHTDRTVARTTVEDILVSTVFLGLDHSYGGAPPLLYETMCFDTIREASLEAEERQWRYSTRAQALAGHREVVAQLEAELGSAGVWQAGSPATQEGSNGDSGG